VCTATEQADGQCAAEIKVPFCSREHIPYSIFACTATEQPDRHTHTHTHTHTHIPNSLTGSAKQALSRISTQTRTEHAHTHAHTHTHTHTEQPDRQRKASAFSHQSPERNSQRHWQARPGKRRIAKLHPHIGALHPNSLPYSVP